MKIKLFLAVVAGMALTALFSFRAIYEAKKNTAEVDQAEGIYIFTDCTPVKDFEFLGTVKNTFSFGGQYQEVRDKLIKKAKKDYPTAEGILIRLKDGGTDKAEAIKFK